MQKVLTFEQNVQSEEKGRKFMNNLTTKEAALLLGKSELFVRMGVATRAVAVRVRRKDREEQLELLH